MALSKAGEAPGSTKARILAAAEAVFAAKGFDGASTREIAAAAGVNISSLHYHWESKETLYFAVFEHLYARIVALVQSAIPEDPREGPERSQVVDDSVGRLFDFLVAHPTVPKLLVRRLLETTDGSSEIERDILLPAWRRFASWAHDVGRVMEEAEVPLFMLSAHSVMLLLTLDSQQFANLLGGNLRDTALRARLRRHVIALVQMLIRERNRA